MQSLASEVNVQSEPPTEVIICPKCKSEGPRSHYCLNCGYPLYVEEREQLKPEATEPSSEMRHALEIEEDAEFPDIETEKPDDLELQKVDKVREEPVVHDQVAKQAAELAAASEIDPIVREVMENLMKSISVRLWLANLLLEGKIKEEHFNRLFDSNKARLTLCMDRRNEMLESARDLDSIEKALIEVKVGLAELEMKKAIGDISEGEYRAKVPALKWDIGKHENEISKRKREIVLLEDLTRVMSLEKIAQMREMAENCRGAPRRPKMHAINNSQIFTIPYLRLRPVPAFRYEQDSVSRDLTHLACAQNLRGEDIDETADDWEFFPIRALR